MKHYTDEVQAARLIQLGFPTPKSVSKLSLDIDMDTIPSFNYSIGELIEMLPRTIEQYYDLNILCSAQGWWVLYGMIGDGDMWSIKYEVYRGELIDALYNMIVKLKEG